MSEAEIEKAVERAICCPAGCARHHDGICSASSYRMEARAAIAAYRAALEADGFKIVPSANEKSPEPR